jgi:hypothetical protein
VQRRFQRLRSGAANFCSRIVEVRWFDWRGHYFGYPLLGFCAGAILFAVVTFRLAGTKLVSKMLPSA